MAILFLGDSYTFGEALELYCDTPKWRNERNISNNWPDLVTKQDSDSIEFREKNRFSNLVGEHFGVQVLQSDSNGGDFKSAIITAEEYLFDPRYTIDTIIFQFTTAQRNSIHSLRNFCECKACIELDYQHLYQELLICARCMIDTNEARGVRIDGWQCPPCHKGIIQWFEKKLGYKITDKRFLPAFEQDQYQFHIEKLEELFIHHINRWEANGNRKIYFIDSWCRQTSDILNTWRYKSPESPGHGSLSHHMNNFIPLLSPDGSHYTSWPEWEQTFPYWSIVSEFPLSENGHPTLLQHQYVAKSIIEYIRPPAQYGAKYGK